MMATSSADSRAWWRVGLLLCMVGWGANHFVPLLLVYREALGLDAAALGLLFSMYALGLVPGLLLAGPLSDRLGRRALVLPSAVLALMASVMIGALGQSFAALMIGRLFYGLAAGGAMSAGAAWVIELSRDAPSAGPRRATIALSAGFGFGPLVSGLVAQYAPSPTVLPYALHATLLGAMLLVARRVPETATATDGPLLRIALDRASWQSFWCTLAPRAPFVFGFPAVILAVLPGMLGGALGPAPIAYTGVLAVVTLGTGVLVQPMTKRLAPSRAARLGLLVGAAGVLCGAAVVAWQLPVLLLAVAPLLGVGYGAGMTSGLQAAQALALPEARGGVTGLYYVLTYVGFAVPYLVALLLQVVSPTMALLGIAGLAALAACTGLRARAALPQRVIP